MVISLSAEYVKNWICILVALAQTTNVDMKLILTLFSVDN